MDRRIPQQAICLSIAADSVEKALEQACNATAFADLVEIRLDTLQDPQVAPFVEQLDKPLLFTNRASWEGGQWQGEEEQRLSLLCQALEAGAAYVDLELRAPEKSWQQLCHCQQSQGVTGSLICSWHDFSLTPDSEELNELFWQMAGGPAQIGKIVTMASDFSDVLRLSNLQLLAHEERFPLACFCMGQAGRVSRAMTLHLGGLMTYGAAAPELATAPGQLTVEELTQIKRLLDD